MPYTTPLTFVAGAPLTAAQMNILGDDIVYLNSNIPVTLLTTRGDLIYRNATVPARLAIGAAGRYLRSDGTDPSWAVPLWSDLAYSGLTTGQVPRATGATTVAFGAVDLANANAVTGVLPIANHPTITEAKGGTNQTTYALGDLIYSAATNTLAKLAGNITTARKFLSQTGNGSVSAAPVWNALVTGDMPAAVGARVYNSANISVGNAATQFLTFNSERFDTSAIHSTSSNTGRLTLPLAGKWAIGCAVSFAANATGGRAIQIWLNGGTVIATTFIPATAGGVLSTDIAVVTEYDFAANDYLELGVYQSSGGNLNVLAAAAYSPEFFCMYRGT